MPNIGGPREAKRRLIASVVQSKLLYVAPVWTSAIENHAIQRRLILVYRTVSARAALVLAGVSPIDLLTEERQNFFCTVYMHGNLHIFTFVIKYKY